MAKDFLGNNINVSDLMIFSAGKSIGIYEVEKIRERRRYAEVYVNVGSSKKWKNSFNGIIYREENHSWRMLWFPTYGIFYKTFWYF